jgi:hypothetical protein
MQRQEAEMAARSCLILYGDSVFLAGIRAQLERDAALDVVTVEPGRTDLLPLLRSRRPRAILFDLATARPDLTVPLLREQPGLLLLGVDPSSNDVLVLSGRPQQALSIADLVQAIHGLPDAGRQRSAECPALGGAGGAGRHSQDARPPAHTGAGCRSGGVVQRRPRGLIASASRAWSSPGGNGGRWARHAATSPGFCCGHSVQRCRAWPVVAMA